MANKKIGIFGTSQDLEVKAIKEELEKRGAEVFVFDQALFPVKTKAIFNGDDFMWDGVNLLEIDAFYGRTIGYFWPIPQQKLTLEEWEAYYETFVNYLTSEREMLSMKFSFVEALAAQKPFINHPSTHQLHRLKIQQYFILRQSGFEIPEYTASNNINDLKSFLDRHGGLALNKPLAGYSHASLIKKDDLEAKINLLGKRPLMLQQYIEGPNIRTYAIGGEFVGAAEIMHTEKYVDSRLEQTGARACDIPDYVKQIALKATEATGMHFSGVDFIYSKQDGKYYLLECNSSPMFAAFSKLTGIDVVGKMAQSLIEVARG